MPPRGDKKRQEGSPTGIFFVLYNTIYQKIRVFMDESNKNTGFRGCLIIFKARTTSIKDNYEGKYKKTKK